MFDKQYPNGMTINQLAELMVIKFTEIDQRLDRVEYRLEVLEHRFNTFEKYIEERLDESDNKFNKHAGWVRASIHHLADIIEDETDRKVVL